MYFMMALVAFGGLMVTAQLKPIAASYGLDKTAVLFGITPLSLALMLDRILNGLTRPFWGWVSDHIGRYNTMALAFALEGLAIIALLNLVHRPVWFVILTGSWIPVLWIAVACDLTAAFLAIAALKPLVARRMARARLATVPAAAVAVAATGND